jgi:predicted helicase
MHGRKLPGESFNIRYLSVSERTDHLEALRLQLTDDIDNLFILKGGLGKKQLKQIMKDMEEKPEHECQVILATGRYLGEGFDLPALDTLFLTFPIYRADCSN